MYDPYQYNCCRHCSNNPAVNPHASGVCFCVLPAMEQAGRTLTNNIKTTTNTCTIVSDFMKGKRK